MNPRDTRTARLAEKDHRIACVMEHINEHHNIEAGVSKWESLSIEWTDMYLCLASD
jgi:hypothetical protein